MNEVDNSKLEELMKIDVDNASQEELDKFFEELKSSQLFLPVTMDEKFYEQLMEGESVELKEDVGFNINYITDDEDNNVVPLFTSYEIMENANLKISTIVIHMSDLAGLLRQAGDKYSIVAVNPFTDFNINMPLSTFLELFRSDEEKELIEEFLSLIREKSVEIEEDLTLTIHCDDNFMVNEAVNGVFCDETPLFINSDPDYNSDLKYTNILILKKSKKLVFIGDAVGEDPYDTVIAPGTEFIFQQQLDDTTSVWLCGNQPFYDE